MLVKTNQKTYDIRDLWPKKKKKADIILSAGQLKAKKRFWLYFVLHKMH